MKKIKDGRYIFVNFCLMMIFFVINDLVFGQTVQRELEVYKLRNETVECVLIIEQQPEFPGGVAALKKFLSQNLATPNNTKKINGKVFVSLVVSVDGSLRDISLVKGLHSAYDKEALRVVKAMPKWIPAVQSGKTVSVRYYQPIEFR
ncbi:TonB family C-terminal domain-containing protein [Dyadobacter koreensis]|uniref:TonB family C-terminal domain-containing protein n=1 Tax=Dyadobacter koreensis TaxID=408657 RepID=A0A1H6YED7_9BACT|nr:energy transducer TonB [Dyadobacter koreensis]SEJ39599.1 TonB family C-terminal domain-containing protein [Dyadobacter koreensis]